jgi:hypothetical protein
MCTTLEVPFYKYRRRNKQQMGVRECFERLLATIVSSVGNAWQNWSTARTSHFSDWSTESNQSNSTLWFITVYLTNLQSITSQIQLCRTLSIPKSRHHGEFWVETERCTKCL